MIIYNKLFAALFCAFILFFSFTVKGEIIAEKSTEEISFPKIDSLKITILYDNYVFKAGTKSDWGFSCLIEGTDKTILFDTGTKSDILFHNISQLNVNIDKIEQIILSHNHGDHTGGLHAVLDKNSNVSVYLPHSFPVQFIERVKTKGASVVKVKDPLKICQNVFLTGEMGNRLREQSLILNTTKGLIIVTGCSHPGIVKIVKKAKKIVNENIYLVIGGFHLMRQNNKQVNTIIEQFKKMGVQKCGATHCTGDAQIELFKKAYGKNYVPMGTGKIINLSK